MRHHGVELLRTVPAVQRICWQDRQPLGHAARVALLAERFGQRRDPATRRKLTRKEWSECADKVKAPIPRETIAAIVEFRRSNPHVSYTEIGKRFGVSHTAAGNHCLAAGLRTKRKREYAP